MTQELTVYDIFQGTQVRKVDRGDGKIWRVFADCCKALGFGNSSQVIKRIPVEYVHLMDILAADNKRYKTWVINEEGLVSLIAYSRLPKEQLDTFREVIGKKATAPQKYSDNIVSLQALKILIDNQILLEQRMDKYEANQQAVNAILAPVKEVSTRLKINQIVRTYAQHHNKDYRECFKTLYYEFKYRYGIDLVGRTHNNGNKTVLDTAEQLGCLDDLFTLAVALFVGK